MATASNSLLVVDDDENNRDMLSRRLARRGYDVTCAVDGQQALEMIAARPFDLILLDVMMPGISGFEVLKILRETYSVTDLPVIMATAKDQSDDIVAAFQAGANDYVTKPLDFPVVTARVQTQLALKNAVDQVLELEKHLSERNRELEQVNGKLATTNARMEKDLRSAARIQESTLPRSVPKAPEAEFAWHFRPCDELAGDGLNVFRLDKHLIGLYVLDVSGHGVASSLLSVALSRLLTPIIDPTALLRQPVEGSDEFRVVPPAEVADQLNRRFSFDDTTEQYFTILYGILDLSTGLLKYACAGHPGLALLPADGTPRILETPGFPIGFSEEGYPEHTVQMHPGDRVLLYSDGVNEAMAPGNEQFGGGRILESMSRARQEPLQQSLLSLMSDVETWVAGASLRDDISMLAVEYKGPA
ncbi:SpoIIE family protein phosphatase [Isosphaeraceae bacterium EP7]